MRRSRTPRPILMLVLGCIGLAIGGALTIYQWNLLKKYPDKPENLTIGLAPSRLSTSTSARVTLSGGQWVCQSIRVYDDSHSADTDVVYRGDSPVVILATFSGNLTCSDLQKQAPTGVIRDMSQPGVVTARQENAYLTNLPDNIQIVALCGYCGPANDQSGLLIGACVFVFGLVLMNVAYQDALKIRFQKSGEKP